MIVMGQEFKQDLGRWLFHFMECWLSHLVVDGLVKDDFAHILVPQ